jgi:hypothetical protein
VLDALDRLEDDTRLTFVYLHQIDMASHLLGIESRLFRRTVRKVDALTAEVVARHRARMGDADLVVFSDHGMSPVEEIVSLPDLWTHPAFPDRFCFALDATMVRLWFHDHDERLHAEIRSRVAARAPRGRFLEPGELADLHLDFDGRLYGDEVYLLEPRVAIFPNFHSMLRPKAMHAYHPDDPEQQGIYLETGREEIDDVVELVEVGRACDRRLGIRAGELVAHGD